VSSDGINWLRGDGLVEGHRSAEEQLKDVGVVLGPNGDNWWTLDTAHLSVSDVQVRGDGGTLEMDEAQRTHLAVVMNGSSPSP
jgi:hypothetical protein